jgi:hypothetical protein
MGQVHLVHLCPRGQSFFFVLDAKNTAPRRPFPSIPPVPAGMPPFGACQHDDSHQEVVLVNNAFFCFRPHGK